MLTTTSTSWSEKLRARRLGPTSASYRLSQFQRELVVHCQSLPANQPSSISNIKNVPVPL